ncbi:hypothetical protein [Hymenobacter lucidus]|uniref:DUF1877 family protein n=1 Tax=Hymenobacter lucidus TaxID=2880930 RepID=A0ABS8AVW4_9BACT|nr:hypothetical protein [Hymenobacter lucidus]MCB2409801.1 hypothetical protein [Hymenobacter lucidus]
MDTIRTFSANTEDALWQQVLADMAYQKDDWEYTADLDQAGYRTRFSIEIDLGGGFESGIELTTFTAIVPRRIPFRFALHEQDWMHKMGKLLGLTDVELGDPEIDAAYIITTNDPATLHDLLADETLRQTLLRYQELRLDLAPESEMPESDVLLTFTKEAAITDPEQLREIYHLFYSILRRVMTLPATLPNLEQQL